MADRKNAFAPAPVNALADPSRPYFGNPNIAAQVAKTRALRTPQNEEQQFQQWIRSTPWFAEFVNQYNEEPDLNTKDYDYRSAWKAGIKPERDPYDQNRYHWPSSLPDGKMLKDENHPTAWKEYFMRDTGQNPDALGIRTPQDAQVYLGTLQKRR